MEDKTKGKMKEACGAIIGDEDKKAERSRGRALPTTKPRRRRVLGNITDSLTGW